MHVTSVALERLSTDDIQRGMARLLADLDRVDVLLGPPEGPVQPQAPADRPDALRRAA